MNFFPRKLVFGVIALGTTIEFVFFYVINAVLTSVSITVENGDDENYTEGDYKKLTSTHIDELLPEGAESPIEKHLILHRAFSLILEENGQEVHDFIRNYVLSAKAEVRIISTTTRFNIYALEVDNYACIINLQRINDIKRINKFFEAVNSKLSNGALFIGKAETYVMRKLRILGKYPWPLNYLIYMIDFMLKRIWPKLPILNRLYFVLTHGHNRVISRAETLGRLYSCGFEIVEERFINKELYFVVRKIKEPLFPEDPTYGPLIKLKRIGKEGKYFNVYKMRTMHPYAEYLQGYVFEKNNLEVGGKIKDDFRVTTLGRIMRKLWIDELPMFINLFRGEMKIVGVRPLSTHYYNLYTEELKQLRILSKPGLVPPFYADLPKTLDEIMDSEMRYLIEHQKHPLKTDINYFFKAWKNIIFKHARSN
jgi:lipopolysaccharide/colanic/teichoic acid biosynthesis glycosyltransferase